MRIRFQFYFKEKYLVNQIKNQKGFSILLFLMVLGFVALLFQSSLVTEALTAQKGWLDSITFTNKHQLVNILSDNLAEGISLQFSRYQSNSDLERCLKGQPTPCDEAQTYDMVLYAPIGQQSFQGGLWPPAPAGALLLAGKRTTDVALFRATGSRCPNSLQTTADVVCPLQALIEFRPLCGGTLDVPTYSGAACTGPANGFDIIIGVARFMNGTLIYHKNTQPGGDAQMFRISASVFR